MKRRIISLLTAVTLVASLFTAVPASAEGNYKSFDLSLTQTTFSGLGETGSIKANLIETVDTLPQRKAITEGTVTYTTADSSVIALNSDGTFTTVGYGVANVEVVYDNNTADASDDASSKVMITVSDRSKLEIYPGEDNTIYTKKDGAAPATSALDGYYQLAQDPVGTDDDPLVIHSINNTGVGEATDAVVPGETAVFSGWFYDTMQKPGQNFIGFGYAGRTDAASVKNDGNSSIGISAQDASNYKLLGGVYSSWYPTTNYNYGKFADDGVTLAEAKAGVQNAGTRTVGWHQFVVTAETSIVNPGTDYMLVKAYLDGELITSQDIYVGNVPVEKRRFNIYPDRRYSSTGADVYYKDLIVKTFKRSGVIAETLPSDNAVNVPLRQLIKLKLASARASAPSVSVTANGGIVSSSAALDSTGTIVTVNAGKLTADTEYVVDVEGESFNFTTGSDSEMSAMIDGMTDYRMVDTRYVDFADTDKTAEEYGVGYIHNNPGTKSEVKDDNYLTMTEGERTTATAYQHQNGIVIRNISPRNGDADRVVVSYKFRPQSIATDPKTSSGGIGRPYMAIDNPEDTYNNLTTAMISGANANALPAIVDTAKTGYIGIRHHMLQNNDGSGKQYALTNSGVKITSTNFYIPIPGEEQQTMAKTNYALAADSDGWHRLTYVIDVDKNGVNTPDWTTIWGNELNDEYSIFELKTAPKISTAYTSVDAIYIPTTNQNAFSNDIVIDIKDIEVYQLAKTLQATIDAQPVVTEAGTETEVLAGNLAGKTVDVAINAQGNGEAYTVIVAAITDTNRLLNAKTGSGKLGTSKNIGVEGFAIPAPEDGEEVKLYVFVWDSFENVVPLFKKIEYTKAQ